MRVKFIWQGESLPPSMLKLGYSPTVNLHLERGLTYIVYGIMMWRSVVHYLLIPTDVSVPYWLPSDIFEVDDPKLPCEWYFRYFGDEDPSDLKFLIGYKEMVVEGTHYADLIEREVEAVRIFFIRKRETDERS